ESPKTRKAFAAKLDQMIDMLAEQIHGVAPKAARKQAVAKLATMMGTIVLARIAGSGEFSDEVLSAGREAALGRAPAAKKPAAKKATMARHKGSAVPAYAIGRRLHLHARYQHFRGSEGRGKTFPNAIK